MSLAEEILRKITGNDNRKDIRSPEFIATEKRRAHDQRITNINETNRTNLYRADQSSVPDDIAAELGVTVEPIEFYDWNQKTKDDMATNELKYQQTIYNKADLCTEQEKHPETLPVIYSPSITRHR